MLLALGLAPATGAGQPTRAEFEAWRNQRLQQFADELSKQDREFAEFLKQRWVATRGEPGVSADPTPKPIQPPVAEHRPPRVTAPLVLPPPPPPVPIPRPAPVVTIAPSLATAPTVAPPSAPTPPVASPPTVAARPAAPPPSASPALGPRPVRVSFLGRELAFPTPPDAFSARLQGRPGPDAIAGFWTKVAAAPGTTTVDALRRARDELALDDWPYAVLVGRYASALHRTAPRDAALLTWFMLCRSGLDARIAYHDQGIVLMVNSSEALFDVPYLTIASKRYYAAALDGSRERIPTSLYTFEGTCPGEVKPLDLRFRTVPNTAGRRTPRALAADHQGRTLRAALDYDPDLVELFGTWPQMRIDDYFTAAVPPDLARSWAMALRPLVEGRSEGEAVDTLLALFQKGMPYKTDEEQFGREDYLFPLETLRYPAADCEDRAVLFAYLLRDVLGLEALGVDFPGHVAVVVRFHGDVPGAGVESGGLRYVIADPTYIGAGAGQAMPDLDLGAARVIAPGR